MMIEDRDVELLKEYMEQYGGNLKVIFFHILIIQKVEEATQSIKTQIKQIYMVGMTFNNAGLSAGAQAA